MFKDFALGTTFIDKVVAVWYRIFGCDHEGSFFIDVGDEEHEDWYCFRCNRSI